jgi:hypothetical protein
LPSNICMRIKHIKWHHKTMGGPSSTRKKKAPHLSAALAG